ncbi:MAG TPA: calcium:proton antiporter [Gammaproteobacteria bacterium]|nr:calcium:proton antiporter [Gammaproteobacteria bacterium]
MNIFAFFRREPFLVVSVLSAALFLCFGDPWLTDLSNPWWFTAMFAWLFLAILFSAFAVVRHAEGLAVLLGEPLGTLVLTLAVTGIEVMVIAAVMYTGPVGSTLARDAMFAVVMIVLNGMMGTTLLLGGLKHHEQSYNLQGANAFLALILPLAVLSLVLPDYASASLGPVFSNMEAVFLVVMSIGLYAVFLAIQSVRHKNYFLGPAKGKKESEHHGHEARSLPYHGVMLALYLLPLVVLSKKLALPIDYGIQVLHAPSALGGFLVAVLILSPESMAAVRATLANELQRSVNILMGSVLATISLTVPAVLVIGFMTHQSIILGLGSVDVILLLLTLVLSTITFASARTNILHGAVHLLLFLAYLMLIFEK